MKLTLGLLLLALVVSPAKAAVDDPAAVRRAEERRIQATITGDAATLSELLSDDLHYAHSDGRVQSKSQLIAALSSHGLDYDLVESEKVKYQAIAPGAATLTGQTRLVVESEGRRVAFTLRFLSVWREEAGHWRLLAYQSSQLPAASSAVK